MHPPLVTHPKDTYIILMIFIFAFILLAACAILFRSAQKRQLRQTLLASPLTDEHRSIVLEHVPLFQKIPADLHPQLEGKINLFLHQVEFIGCDGLDVTPEMELSIAAQACLMIANTDMWYNSLQTALIYPGAFRSRQTSYNGHIATTRFITRIGESWARGPIILSWAHAHQGSFIDDDGHNVVIHEFTHQLDNLSGYTDGIPILKRGHSLRDWNAVFTAAYARHVANINTDHKTPIDAYGATLPVEYFAVVVELFFERPTALQKEEPTVYEQLSKFFDLDPVSWK